MSIFNSPLPQTDKMLYRGYLKSRQPLSKKEARTFLIQVGFEAPLPFTSGDSIAIYPLNPEKEVLEICQALHLDPDRTLSAHLTVFEFLQKKVSLHKWTTKLSEFLFHTPTLPDSLVGLSPTQILQNLTLTEEKALAILELLSPQLPRYYSIASAPDPTSLHCDLLVTLNAFDVGGVLKYGVASSYLCMEALLGAEILCFIHKADHFRLPEGPHPMIMIGPGTGVAPFRAFIQERIKQQQHDNWLFFGERSSQHDFFFEEEWNAHILQNKLHLSVAFSRDQEEKIYVQHRLYEERDKLREWIEKGALIYICGDAKKMARDVEQTLIQLISDWSNIDFKSAQLKLREWKKSKRYLLDIY